MSIDENSFEEILQEQLELSGVLVDEAEEDDEPEDQYDILRNAKGVEKEEEKPKEDKEEKDDEPEEELADANLSLKCMRIIFMFGIDKEEVKRYLSLHVLDKRES
jgi:hypothetical protein